MGRQLPDDTLELIELPAKLIPDRCHVVDVELALVLAPNIPVKADSQPGVVAAYRRRFPQRPARHHEAGAGEYAVDMAFHNAPVHAGRGSKVISVKNKIFCHTNLSRSVREMSLTRFPCGKTADILRFILGCCHPSLTANAYG